MLSAIEGDWRQILAEEQDKPYMAALTENLERSYEEKIIYPKKDHLFYALNLTAFAETKVVILGQDPYHGPGQAYGLSFSVMEGVKHPPSLRNIFKELASDIGCETPQNGCLDAWAKQGVLLLNTVLTVEDGQAGSHQGIGWEQFTNRIIELLNDREEPVVFVLWGKHAQEKKKMINANKHCIIESVHPSPLSAHRGFFGSKPFSKANQFLRQHGQTEIDWRLLNV
ncbi:uracil-DNA glycosylase [Paenibacillus sp. IITD108]|uniref:uracil-DNA glycosylase n=1 Tax=Paenibacillus sp. IITD108 TaxID=3116649 RepID=UPI002F3E68F4